MARNVIGKLFIHFTESNFRIAFLDESQDILVNIIGVFSDPLPLGDLQDLGIIVNKGKPA